MTVIPITDDMYEAVVKELKQSTLFSGLADKDLKEIAKSASMVQYDKGDIIIEQGTVSDSFYVIVSGEAIMQVAEKNKTPIEVTRVRPYDTLGEIGLILNQPRSVTVVAGPDTILLKFDSQFFSEMFKKLPDFALVTCKVMAKRAQVSQRNILMQARARAASEPDTVETAQSAAPELDDLLRRMVDEKASDMHLSSSLTPRWRIDGSIAEIPGTSALMPDDIKKLADTIIPKRNRLQFQEENDTDFAYSIPDVARFRVNMFCDNKGPGLVFRQIPDKILTIEQLGLPPIVTSLCEYPKGLILVTGPTGSGKSTTLAAMVDHVNKLREDHIITMEDPIEFVHIPHKCLVNQREVGSHTKSFSRALRAALREDPDIVLVGEMRDLETVQLALEVANTGHLVFGTLHTNTAISTVSRIIDMFPAGQQNQIRTVLADTLKGVIAQTLCKRIGGGRIAALEILVSDTGVANLIREGKTQMLTSSMQMGKSKGNRLLNEELARLVEEKIISEGEALSRSVDKADLASKLEALKNPE